MGLQENNNTFQESWLRANQLAMKNNKLLEAQNSNTDNKRFSRRQNIPLDNVFLFKTLYIISRKHVCLTQSVILSSTSNFFATIATHCNYMRPLKSKYHQRLHFFASVNTLTDLSGNIGFLQRVQKVRFVNCNWLISTHVVDFVSL